ncbi:hypothetical protein MASR2M48_30910 [Spirochaetota bacterium]
MKKKYSLDRIVAGSSFTEDAFSEGDILFAPKGLPIKAKDLEGLKRWNINYVFSEGQLDASRRQETQCMTRLHWPPPPQTRRH